MSTNSNLDTEKLARIIVSSVDDTELDFQQRVQIVDDILQNNFKLTRANKGYQFKDLVEEISKIDEFLMFDYKAEPNVLGKGRYMSYDIKEELIKTAWLFCLEDCYGIFFENNSFTIATVIMDMDKPSYSEIQRGSRGFFRFGMIDCATNNQLKYVKCGLHDKKDVPKYFFQEQGTETLDDGQTVYFIRLRNLLNSTKYGNNLIMEERHEMYGNSISREFIELIIKTVNDYLNEYPAFVEQAVLRRVRKSN